ncbi:hypothetical protein R0290_21105 [Burkholderia semiarida]|uniref:hypothetical protein n=1 Tax=Burkholderia TaxID=32008 RepID=UPI00265F1BB2|nr:hypothetical protein [Burkholderia sp. AU44665]MDN7698618.1 hypothetical protein [Burkholderia sp. AU44665]
MALQDALGPNADSIRESSEVSLTREKLYELVWSQPMTKIAAEYKVSSSYLARVCTKLRVPRPARGYWAKLAVGIQLKIPPLPDVRPGDEQTWNRDGYATSPSALPQPPSEVGKSMSLSRTKSPTRRSGQHGLIRGARELFESGRVSSYSYPKYLKPAKKLLVDLAVTQMGLDRALTLANQLFLELEGHGFHVAIAPHGQILHRASIDERENPPKRDHGYHHQDLWSPLRCTVVYVGTVAIGITIIEMSESAQARYVNGEYIRESEYVVPKRRRSVDHTWTTTREFATGRLCLQAYSPYPGTNWKRCWKESKEEGLISQISEIIQELEVGANEIARLVVEEKQRAEAQRREWELDRQKRLKEDAERRAVAALKESKEDLLQFIARWAEARNIEQFLTEIEADLSKLEPSMREHLTQRLEAARELFDEGSALDHLRRWRTPQERLTGSH